MSDRPVSVVRAPEECCPSPDCEYGEALAQALEERAPPQIAIDLSAPKWFTPAGLGLLCRAHKQARELGGDVRLFSLSSESRRVLHLVGIAEAFRIFATEAEAKASFDE